MGRQVSFLEPAWACNEVHCGRIQTEYKLHAWPSTCVRAALNLSFERLPFVIAIPLVFPRLGHAWGQGAGSTFESGPARHAVGCRATLVATGVACCQLLVDWSIRCELQL